MRSRVLQRDLPALIERVDASGSWGTPDREGQANKGRKEGIVPTFAVDWDGTCVANKYPEQGEWLPGAVEALYILDQLGTIIIHSVRVAPVKPFTEGRAIPAPGDEEPFTDGQPEREVAYIREMLDEVGLGHVEIWRRPYKPPAAIYIDDRAIRYTGDWDKTIVDVLDVLAPLRSRR